jgi:DNA-binding NarL/FixJ family response regulator
MAEAVQRQQRPAAWERALLPGELYGAGDARWHRDRLVLTTFDADELVVGALRAGAAGFLVKDSAPAEIVRAIESAHAGDGSFSPAVSRRLIALVAGDSEASARRERARRRLASLTNREREVAVAVGEGRANAEIAHDLHMSVATVKAHVSRLLSKLGVDNRVQIAILIHDAASGFDEQNSTT